MQVFIVEYTTQECVGNQTLQMEIEAPELGDVYDILDNIYPVLDIDCIYPKESAFDYYGA